MEVSDDLESCTNKVQCAVIDDIPSHPRLQGRRLVIVDTPGFGDTYLDDTDILDQIAKWLASS